MCRKIVYESIGEEIIYERFRASGKLSQSLCHEATRLCQKGGQEQKHDKNSKKAKQPKSNGKHARKDDQLTKTDAQPSKEPLNRDKPSNEGDVVDVTYFLTQIAQEHNVPTNAYIDRRSRKEWETTILQIAGRLYNGKALEDPVKRV